MSTLREKADVICISVISHTVQSKAGCSIGGKVVNQLPPKKRGVAMVFQNYALYPHMAVFDNLAFALKVQGLGKAEIAERVSRITGIVDQEDYLQRKPAQLSGGQRS